jgi:hypothetical protein
LPAPDGLSLPDGLASTTGCSGVPAYGRIFFRNYNGVHSYGRRLPGLRFIASPPKRLTNSLNLPAPGRRQTLYVLLPSSQSPVFLVNSRYPLLSATPGRSGSKSLHGPGHTFFRSYGVILPSSLTTVLSSALACSARPPVSVSGTVTRWIPYEAFLGSMGSPALRALRLSTSPLGVEWRRGFAYATRLRA